MGMFRFNGPPLPPWHGSPSASAQCPPVARRRTVRVWKPSLVRSLRAHGTRSHYAGHIAVVPRLVPVRRPARACWRLPPARMPPLGSACSLALRRPSVWPILTAWRRPREILCRPCDARARSRENNRPEGVACCFHVSLNKGRAKRIRQIMYFSKKQEKQCMRVFNHCQDVLFKTPWP